LTQRAHHGFRIVRRATDIRSFSLFFLNMGAFPFPFGGTD
jgi:hypothetical protein